MENESFEPPIEPPVSLEPESTESEDQQGLQEQPKPEPEKKNTNWLLIIFIVLLLILVGMYIYTRFIKKTDTNPLPTETTYAQSSATATSSPTSSATTTSTSEPSGDMKKYTDNSWGFEFQYPSDYQTVNDTYGWPHALAHLMPQSGGQSYEGQIEWWDTESEFKETYNYDPKYIVKHPNGKNWITIYYYTDPNDIWQGIIDSFKFK